MQSEHKSGPSSFQVIEASVSRLDASPAIGRRRWSAAAKERIVAEALVPGANVSEIARAHGLSPQQLFAWRRKAVQVAGLAGASGGSFASVEVVDPETGGMIELVFRDVVIRVGPGVSVARVREVLRAVRSA